jgi:quinol monooxygenase YgiN
MVRFHLEPAGRERARAAMLDVARLMHDVPGCRRFEVFEPEEDAEHLWFSELWRDRASFEQHSAERPAAIAALARTIAATFASPPEVATYTVLA